MASISGGHFEPVIQMRRLETVPVSPFDEIGKTRSKSDLIPVRFCLPSNPSVSLDEAFSRLQQSTNPGEDATSCDGDLDSTIEERMTEILGMGIEYKRNKSPRKFKRENKSKQSKTSKKEPVDAQLSRSEESLQPINDKQKSSHRRRSLSDTHLNDGQLMTHLDNQSCTSSVHSIHASPHVRTPAPRTVSRTPVDRPSNPTPSTSAERSQDKRPPGHRREKMESERDRMTDTDRKNELARRLIIEREREEDRQVQRQAAQCIINAYNQAYKLVEKQTNTQTGRQRDNETSNRPAERKIEIRDDVQANKQPYISRQTDRRRDTQDDIWRYKQPYNSRQSDRVRDTEQEKHRYREEGRKAYGDLPLSDLLKELTPDQHRQVRKVLEQELRLYNKL